MNPDGSGACALELRVVRYGHDTLFGHLLCHRQDSEYAVRFTCENGGQEGKGLMRGARHVCTAVSHDAHLPLL